MRDNAIRHRRQSLYVVVHRAMPLNVPSSDSRVAVAHKSRYIQHETAARRRLPPNDRESTSAALLPTVCAALRVFVQVTLSVHPRDSMPARLWPASLCHKPIFCRNGCMDPADCWPRVTIDLLHDLLHRSIVSTVE